MTDFSLQTDAAGVATLLWSAQGRSMNLFTSEAIDELAALVERIAADPAVRGVVIASGKPSFSGGADLAMFEQLHRAYLADVETMGRTAAFDRLLAETSRLSVLFRRIETCGKPFVAAVTGHCLGGGLELVLACHAHLAADAPDVRVGLPEIRVGLFPGAGGTQRLPRLIGVERALPLMLEGRHISGAEAREVGLFDAVVPTERLIGEAKALLARGVGTARRPEKPPRAPSPAALAAIIDHAKRSRPDLMQNYPAARALVAATMEGLHGTLAAGLTLESRLFAEILGGREAAAMMRTLFLNPQAISRRTHAADAGLLATVALVGEDDLANAAAGLLRKADVRVTRMDTFGSPPGGTRLVLVGRARDAPSTASPDVTFALLGRAPDADSGARLGLHFGTRPDTAGTLEIAPAADARPDETALAVALARRLRRIPIVLRSGHGFLGERIGAALFSAVDDLRDDGVSPEEISAALLRAGWPAAGGAMRGDRTRMEERAFFLLAAPALAAARSFAEGALGDASTVDVCAVYGADFPSYTGGPLAFIDGIGAAGFLARLESSRWGRDETIPQLLNDMAREGGSFYGGSSMSRGVA